MTTMQTSEATSEAEGQLQGNLNQPSVTATKRRDPLMEFVKDHERIFFHLSIIRGEEEPVRKLVLKIPESVLKDDGFWDTLKSRFILDRKDPLGLTTEEMRRLSGEYLRRDFFPLNMEEHLMLSFFKAIHHLHHHGKLFEYREMLNKLAQRNAEGGKINGHNHG